jgi:membrane protein implicated in regulation of membrane protease activity
MTELYAVLAGVGTLLILAQLLGAGDDDLDHHDTNGHDGGLHLTNLRAIGVGLAAFGFAGLILDALGMLGWLVLAVALVAGISGLLLTAWILMRVARLEEDANVRIGDTLGERATVYIPIAPDMAGKVQVTARGRTMEYRAVADHPLASGTPVLITGLRDDDTVEVEPV